MPNYAYFYLMAFIGFLNRVPGVRVPPGTPEKTKPRKPERHFLRALGWFDELGLREVNTGVFADSACAPLNDEVKRALEELFKERWPNVAAELAPGDLADFQRLCLPDSPDLIINLPDYYAFFTITMFWGKIS